MGPPIQPPEHSSPKTRRLTSRLPRKFLNAAVLAAVLVLWLLAGVPWVGVEDDEGPGIEMQATVGSDLGEVIAGVENLVVVSCHAIWLGGSTAGDNEAEWAIEPFQKGETTTFIKHIERGIEIASRDPQSLLVFSGGETKASVGPRSEADGYFDLAVARNLLSPSLLARTTTEESATDSYQNVLFSIARFHEVTGNYPTLVTVVSHDFKRARFELLHRTSIRYPAERFRFVGIDPDWEQTASVQEEILKFEAMTRRAWEMDPYACAKNGELGTKRRGRNLWRRFNSYTTSCPELTGLLSWCGLENQPSRSHLYSGMLPWRK